MNYERKIRFHKEWNTKLVVLLFILQALFTTSCNKADINENESVEIISPLIEAGYEEITIRILPTTPTSSFYFVLKNDTIYSAERWRFIENADAQSLDLEEQKWIKYLVENLETDVIEESKFYKDSWVVTVAVNDKIVYRQNISQRYYSQPRRVSELLYTISALSVIEFDLFDYN